MPALGILENVPGITIVRLDEKDIIRHELVTRVLGAFKQLEEKEDKR
jgi:phosphate starvation-inducible PhoH-like protein